MSLSILACTKFKVLRIKVTDEKVKNLTNDKVKQLEETTLEL
jgi:hypothetical protein